MLNKTILISVDKLRPTTPSLGEKIVYIVAYSVCYYIKKYLNLYHYNNLEVTYNYSAHNVHSTPSDFYELSLRDINEHEYLTVNYMLEKAIGQSIEEFNVYIKSNKNSVLNFVE